MDGVIFSPIDSIYVAANFGEGSSFGNVSGAMEYISSYDETTNERSIFTEYYITIIYKEGNKVEIRAKDKISAQDFLEKFL